MKLMNMTIWIDVLKGLCTARLTQLREYLRGQEPLICLGVVVVGTVGDFNLRTVRKK